VRERGHAQNLKSKKENVTFSVYQKAA
jgi:hypothetical protein